jgi:hypothetical protein
MELSTLRVASAEKLPSTAAGICRGYFARRLTGTTIMVSGRDFLAELASKWAALDC